jgi:plastocyanin
VPRPSCQPARVVTIGGDGGAFSPQQLTLQMGQFVNYVDTTKTGYTLEATPDAGLGSAGIAPGETQPIQFNLAGTYTIRSKESKGMAAMTVVVQNTVGLTCGIVPAAADLTLGKGSFSPPSLAVKPGQGISIINGSGADAQIACTPDPGIAKKNLQLDAAESQTVIFPRAGTFTCSADQGSGAKATITVG